MCFDMTPIVSATVYKVIHMYVNTCRNYLLSLNRCVHLISQLCP